MVIVISHRIPQLMQHGGLHRVDVAMVVAVEAVVATVEVMAMAVVFVVVVAMATDGQDRGGCGHSRGHIVRGDCGARSWGSRCCIDHSHAVIVVITALVARWRPSQVMLFSCL